MEISLENIGKSKSTFYRIERYSILLAINSHLVKADDFSLPTVSTWKVAKNGEETELTERTWNVALARTGLADGVVRNANVRPEIGYRRIETDVALPIASLGDLLQRVIVTLQ